MEKLKLGDGQKGLHLRVAPFLSILVEFFAVEINNPTRKAEIGKGTQGGVKRSYEKDFADKTIVVVIGESLPKSKNVLGITVWRKEG